MGHWLAACVSKIQEKLLLNRTDKYDLINTINCTVLLLTYEVPEMIEILNQELSLLLCYRIQFRVCIIPSQITGREAPESSCLISTHSLVDRSGPGHTDAESGCSVLVSRLHTWLALGCYLDLG